MKDILFHYVVTGYDDVKKHYTCQYQNKLIHTEGDSGEYNKGGFESLPEITYETIKKGIQLYNKKFSNVEDQEKRETDALKEVLKQKAVVVDEDVSVDDLDEVASTAVREWMDMAVPEVEFKLTGKIR